MLYEWKIAIRFLRDGKAQTLFILLGIAVGVAVQVFLSSLIGGLQDDLVNSTIGNSPQITVKGKEQNFENLSSTAFINTPKKNEELENFEDVMSAIGSINSIKSISPSINGNGFLRKGNRNSSIIVKGINLELADQIYNINSRLVSGTSFLDANYILIGKSLAEEFDYNIDDILQITLPQGEVQNFIVGGIFDLETENLNSSWIFMELTRAQRLYNLGGNINSLEIQVDEPFEADIIAKRIEEIYPSVETGNWKEQNAQLLTALTSQSSSSLTIQAFVLLAIALGISSVLAVSVVQKSKQIGILKAMGTTSNSASRIFLLQGGVLGLLGGVTGVILGFGLIQGFLIGTETASGPLFPLTIERENIVLVIIVSTMAGIISSFIPAKKSSSLNPMEVIRNG